MNATEIETGFDKQYYENSSFSIVGYQGGFYVLNNLTSGLVMNTSPMTWENAKSERLYQLAKRNIKY